MSQQELNGAQVGPGFEQVGCKTVPKRMGRDRFDNAATLMRLLARMLYRRLADMPADLIAREEPLLGPGYWPPVTQDLQQLWRKHNIAVFLPFALFDSNDHSLAVDIGDFQADSLRNAQPSRITGRQDGAMLDALYAAQELQDLLRTQDNRQLLRLLRRRDNFFQAPILMKRDFVEEAKSGYGDED